MSKGLSSQSGSINSPVQPFGDGGHKVAVGALGMSPRKVRMASWKITIFIGDRYLRCLINCESSFGWIGMADVCSTCRCNLSSECFATNLWLLRDGSLFHRSLWMMDVVRRIRHIPFWFQGLHLLKSGDFPAVPTSFAGGKILGSGRDSCAQSRNNG